MARPGEFQELPEEMIRVACGMHSGPTYRTVNTAVRGTGPGEVSTIELSSVQTEVLALYLAPLHWCCRHHLQSPQALLRVCRLLHDHGSGMLYRRPQQSPR